MSKTDIDYPVIIVGAGPTGLLAANILGMAGIKTLLIEKSGGTSQLPKAILIDDEGLRSVQSVGLVDEVKKDLVMGYGARYHTADGECFASIAPDTQEYGYPRRNSFLQPDLESVLLKGLSRFPSVDVVFNTELIYLDNGEHKAAVTMRTAAGERSLSASCVLACDGGKSTVRNLLDIALEGKTYSQDWIVIDTVNDPDKDKYSKFFCDPARPGVSIPAPHGGRRYEFRLMDGEVAHDVIQADFVKALLKPFRDIASDDITRATVYTFHAKIAETLCSNRVVLMGDAAHLTPPFAGQGMNAGLRDAHNVAWKAILFVQGKADLSIFKTYDEERRGPIAAMIDFAIALGNIVMPTSQLQAEIVKTLLDTLSLFPDRKDYVLNMKFKPKPQYKSGLLIADSTADTSVAGKLIPQPEVRHCKTGESTLLDHYLGEGFAVLAFGVDTLLEIEENLPSFFPDLAPDLVCIVEDTSTVSALATDKAVVLSCDDTTFLDFIKACWGKVLLIRPDRYVAGVFLPSEIEIFADLFSQKLHGQADL